MAFGEFFWGAAVRGDCPDILFDTLRRILWIRIRAVDEFEIAAARVDNRLGIWGPTDLAEVLAVVVLIGSDLASFVASVRAGIRDPQIARALCIEDPSDAALGGRGRQLGGKRRAQKLFERG